MNVKKGKWLVILLAIAMLAAVGSAGLSVTENNNDVECVRYGQGFWKQWLAEQDENWVCTMGFSAEQLLDWLNTPARGDATQILLYQFIAASLNIGQYGCEMPPVVQEAYDEAFAHLVKYLEYGIGTTEDRSVILEWKDILEFWNENKHAKLLSVEYVGTCETFGTEAHETLTFTFSNDVFLTRAYPHVEFKEVATIGTGNLTWTVEDGNKVVITSGATFITPRPSVGDTVTGFKYIVDFIGEPVVVPDGGVEVVKVGGKCLVDIVVVDSSVMVGANSVVLEDGQQYRFVASGTWKNGNVHTAVDAEYRLSVGETVWESSVGRSLRLQVNEEYFNWSDGVFNPAHVYEAYFIGEGETVNFRIIDGDPPVPSWYNDNEGSLTVEIYKVW